MGQTTMCTAEFEGDISRGTALLESNEVVFRGTFRVVVPFKEVQSVEAKSGDLKLTFAGKTISLQLGPLAEKWASKILHPKRLIDKLGIKSESKVTVLGIRDESFEKELRNSKANVSRGTIGHELDTIIFLAETREELAKLSRLTDAIKKDGAIWAIYPKGRQVIREIDVITAAKQAGLVDTKVVSFSEKHTGLKLVIPKSRR